MDVALPSTADSPLSGAFNFRDVGGLLSADGFPVRSGRLFRSDTLQALTDQDVRLLSGGFGIRSVLDLRTPGESITQGRPVLDRSMRYLNIPLEDIGDRGTASDDPLADIYLGHLARDPNLPVAVEMLAGLLPQPTVVNCAAGKDRTGMVIALALGLAGVPREAIVGDYLRSAANMPRVVERFRSWPRYRDNVRRLPAALYECRESTVLTFLDSIERTYGGFEGWAEYAGVSTTAIAELRQALLLT